MKTLIKIYIGLTLLLLLDLIFYLTSGISLATNLADQILSWSWIILTFIVVFGNIKKRWSKIYGMSLIGLTILSLFPMGIPFLTAIAFMIPNPSPDYIYRDKDIRVELTAKSVIGKPYIAVIKNFLIIEKEIAGLESEFKIGEDYYGVDDIESVSVQNSENRNGLILSFDFGFETINKEIKTSHNKRYNQ